MFSKKVESVMNIFLFFLILFFSRLNFAQGHYEDPRPIATPNKKLSLIRSWYRTHEDFIFYDALGDRAVSQKNQQFIASIIDQLHMTDYCIEIRAMSNYAQRIFGRPNAVTIPSFFFGRKAHCFLYISEDWFNTLDQAEKEAIIHRQLLVLKKKYLFKSALIGIFSVLTTCLSCSVASSFIYSNYEGLEVFFKICAVCFIGTNLCILNIAKSYRDLEKEADLCAAQSMQDAESLITLLKKMKIEVEYHYSRFRLKKILQQIGDYLRSFYYMRPSFDERIEYLEEEF